MTSSNVPVSLITQTDASEEADNYSYNDASMAELTEAAENALQEMIHEGEGVGVVDTEGFKNGGGAGDEEVPEVRDVEVGASGLSKDGEGSTADFHEAA